MTCSRPVRRRDRARHGRRSGRRGPRRRRPGRPGSAARRRPRPRRRTPRRRLVPAPAGGPSPSGARRRSPGRAGTPRRGSAPQTPPPPNHTDPRSLRAMRLPSRRRAHSAEPKFHSIPPTLRSRRGSAPPPGAVGERTHPGPSAGSWARPRTHSTSSASSSRGWKTPALTPIRTRRPVPHREPLSGAGVPRRVLAPAGGLSRTPPPSGGAISAFAPARAGARPAGGVARLAEDLRSGRWRKHVTVRYRGRGGLDLGYRLVVAERA